jgi:3-hydroxyacyl-CoA dehydrogenase
VTAENRPVTTALIIGAGNMGERIADGLGPGGFPIRLADGSVHPTAAIYVAALTTTTPRPNP